MTARVRPLFPAGDQRRWGGAVPQRLDAHERARRIQAAQDAAERAGYVRGWRWGWLCGACAGLIIGSLGIVTALQLGLLAGRAGW